jgi:hypothetical protein
MGWISGRWISRPTSTGSPSFVSRFDRTPPPLRGGRIMFIYENRMGDARESARRLKKGCTRGICIMFN